MYSIVIRVGSTFSEPVHLFVYILVVSFKLADYSEALRLIVN